MAEGEAISALRRTIADDDVLDHVIGTVLTPEEGGKAAGMIRSARRFASPERTRRLASAHGVPNAASATAARRAAVTILPRLVKTGTKPRGKVPRQRAESATRGAGVLECRLLNK